MQVAGIAGQHRINGRGWGAKRVTTWAQGRLCLYQVEELRLDVAGSWGLLKL